MTNALLAPLKRVRLFQSLDDGQLERIARRAERVIYRPGDVICSEGASGDAAILIVSDGAVEVRGEGEPAQPVEAGSLVGEMTMLVEQPYGVTVAAGAAVRALRLTRAGMQDAMLEDRDIAERLIAVISGRLVRVAAELKRLDDQVAQAIPVGMPTAIAQNSAAMH